MAKHERRGKQELGSVGVSQIIMILSLTYPRIRTKNRKLTVLINDIVSIKLVS